MLLRIFIALGSLIACAKAQNPFGIYSGCTNYTSRGALEGSAGDNLLEVPASHFSGIGHAASGTGTVLLGYRHRLQDQNAATVEPYAFVVRADGSGAPLCTPAGLLLQTSALTSPSGSGTLAWTLSATFATPSTVLPQCASFYIGLNFAAAPNWPLDGLSTHVCTYNGPPFSSAADNPAPARPNLGWDCLGGVPVQPAGGRAIRYEVVVEAPVLNVGNTDPNLIGSYANCVAMLLNSQGNPRSFGAGGLWPAVSVGRRDGLDCRLHDASNANGTFLVVIGIRNPCNGSVRIPIATGALYLYPPAMSQVALGTLDATGTGEAVMVPPGAVPLAMANRSIDFQAMTLSPAMTLPARLSNLAGVQY